MKRHLLRLVALSLFSCLFTGMAISQGITAPRTPSPAASVSQTIGISKVTVDYSRPSVRGREVWGALVPYGWNVQNFGNQKSAPWRAGANENTTIAFTHNATVEGKSVPAGTYGLFFTINADNTAEVILSKDYRSWGSFFYEADHDQLRAKIKAVEHPMTELLTYEFVNINKNSADLVLNWEKKQFPVHIEFAVDDIVMANAAEELKNTVGFSWQGYNSAAAYALANNVNLTEALTWSDKAIAANKNFNTLMTKAGLLEATGKKAEADKLSADAVTMGSELELNAYGYQLVGQNDFDKAVKIFTLNTERHPESANTWDSLGECYALKGDKENAVKNFKKSLSMNPPEGVKANSMKYLKQLGEM